MKTISKSRLVFVYFIVAILFFIIIGRLLQISIYSNNDINNRRYIVEKSSNERGKILDRNGIIVASDIATKSLYANPKLIKDTQRTAKLLSQIFDDLDYNQVNKKINNYAQKEWILIRRNLTPNQVLEVKNLHIAGLIFDSDKSRIYPHKSIVSHIVGYGDIDRNGLSGIELSYDRILKQGTDVKLAMDIRLQDILVDELQKTLDDVSAKAAAGVILDINNGEILSLASLPNFDPNFPNDANSLRKFNRVTNGVYELGSVFKIFTNAIVFEENLIKNNEIFDVKKPIKYGKFTISDDHYVKDKMNYEEIFIHSSNIGTVKIAEKIGVKKQKDFIQKIGLTDKIKTDFDGLGKPIYPKKWRDINLYTISYGHGIAVTPLHFAMAASAMVNGGNLINPSFIIKSNNLIKRKVININSSKKILQLLRKVVTEGTGKKSEVDGYEVGGKTGTAEKVELGGYNEKKTIASFVAVFPSSEPKYLLYILFDSPNSQFNTGGMIAAPAAGNIIKNIAPILNLRPVINK